MADRAVYTRLTADTISDEQIRELRESLPLLPTADGERLRRVCGCALGEPGYHTRAQVTARARCAEIINARRNQKGWSNS